MACNLPIVTSDADGCVDVIKNGKFGLMFKKNDTKDLVSKMIKIRNNKIRLKYISKSKQRLKDFEISNVVNNYKKLIFNDKN